MTVALDLRKYDVAISFLASDVRLAEALYSKLSSDLKVFFYPRNQEDLAGTNGLETMRTPFFDQARVVVVLYRPRWGHTDWTRVEEIAVTEGCLHGGWPGLFFVDLENAATFPIWLPETHVRLNWAEFGIEQAVGAIKLRVQDRGGRFTPATALTEAARVRAATDYQQAKREIQRDGAWISGKVRPSIAQAFACVEELCSEARNLGIACQVGITEKACTITNGALSVRLEWIQQYSNTVEKAQLISVAFVGRLPMPGEHLLYWDGEHPAKRGSKIYEPELSITREFVWLAKADDQELDARQVADRCVQQFLQLIESEDRRRP